MKKLVVVALLVSALAACSKKKDAATTPQPSPEVKSDGAAPTGGATSCGAGYGTPAP